MVGPTRVVREVTGCLTGLSSGLAARWRADTAASGNGGGRRENHSDERVTSAVTRQLAGWQLRHEEVVRSELMTANCGRIPDAPTPDDQGVRL